MRSAGGRSKLRGAEMGGRAGLVVRGWPGAAVGMRVAEVVTVSAAVGEARSASF